MKKTIFMRYPGGKDKAVTFSYDDGGEHDLRLLEIFGRYGMKATFNFNGNCRFDARQIREKFLGAGHEIAVHGYYHRANGNCRPIEGIRDVLDCRLELEERCGGFVRGMAYPDSGITRFGNLGNYDMVRQYLVELDIAYARTLDGDNDSFLLPSDFYAWMPSAHHQNPKIMEYIDSFLKIDLSHMYHAHRVPRLLYIWGHSFEFEMNQNWDRIETICEKLAHKDEIWYATNIEIHDYVEAYQSLRYSASGDRVYNPTLITVWIDADGTRYSIAPGETLVF